jgi:hypothetical protein
MAKSEQIMKPKLILSLALVLSGGLLCCRSGAQNLPNANSNSMNDVSAKVQAGYSNFTRMGTNRMGTNLRKHGHGQQNRHDALHGRARGGRRHTT